MPGLRDVERQAGALFRAVDAGPSPTLDAAVLLGYVTEGRARVVADDEDAVVA